MNPLMISSKFSPYKIFPLHLCTCGSRYGRSCYATESLSTRLVLRCTLPLRSPPKISFPPLVFSSSLLIIFCFNSFHFSRPLIHFSLFTTFHRTSYQLFRHAFLSHVFLFFSFPRLAKHAVQAPSLRYLIALTAPTADLLLHSP